jgi:hypothetical protein
MRLSKTAMMLVSVSLLGLGSASSAIGADAPAATTKQGSVNYMTGGVGDDDIAALKRAAVSYPLELEFSQQAQPKSEFIADVKVTVRDRAGKVLLDAASGGPFMLVDLPTGRYDVEASYEGQSKRQSVDVRKDQHRKVVFVWPSRPGAETAAQ